MRFLFTRNDRVVFLESVLSLCRCQDRFAANSAFCPMSWKGAAPAPINSPSSVDMFIFSASERREYLAFRLGRGKRFSLAPMSPMHAFPHNPGAARLNGRWRRSGHCTTLAAAVEKFFCRDLSITAASSSNAGGCRECRVTVMMNEG
ncbi:hypothetical protein BDV59DRAFT_175272 [Aspergillus ambiguus]|uniref:uncharacterized protein n=1 Tax=Aspergillus ambiguus TaxID=176160 RepID=UPI003CCE2AE6